MSDAQERMNELLEANNVLVDRGRYYGLVIRDIGRINAMPHYSEQERRAKIDEAVKLAGKRLEREYDDGVWSSRQPSSSTSSTPAASTALPASS